MKNINIQYCTPQGELQKADTSKFDTTYDLIKHYVGGTIDCSSIGNLDMWVDDEGLLKRLNPTLIIKRDRTAKITNYDTILVGPVVFASHNVEGDTIGLTNEAQKILNTMKKVLLGPYPIFIIENYRESADESTKNFI